jgi:hypothetical protein
MTERSVIFPSPMIVKLLNDGKTQTRRMAYLINGQPSPWMQAQPGDRVWVRESWQTLTGLDDASPSEIGKLAMEQGARKPWAPVSYAADGAYMNADDPEYTFGRLREAIHMPRWLSRITLEIVEAKRQRVQDITALDAYAEGYVDTPYDSPDAPIAWFAQTWDALHGAGSWASNPEVVALSFLTTKGNIDD